MSETPGMHDSPIDELLGRQPFSVANADKHPLLLAALLAAHRHHFRNCAAYRAVCESRGLGENTRFEDVVEFPYLPVQAFKRGGAGLRSVPDESLVGHLNSSATSGVPSRIDLDRLTAKRQVRALTAVLGAVLGPKRRPFVVVDVDPAAAMEGEAAARTAAVRGFLNLASEADYVMKVEESGRLAPDLELLASVLARHEAAGRPIVLFGFTYVLYVHAALELMATGKRFRLPQGSKVVHIGGWKKLIDREVSKAAFMALVSQVFGVPEADVVDFYGFTEQMGVTYPDDAEGRKVVPVFAEVVVRDPVSLAPVPDGVEGLLEFLTPVPWSYPGIAVLTDDVGVIESRDSTAGGWHGTRFRVLGRAKKAEVRGCGDIMAEKVVRPAMAPSTTAPQRGVVEVLADVSRNYAAAGSAIQAGTGEPRPSADLGVVCARLLHERSRLDAYSVDDLIALISAAARRWIADDSALLHLRQQGLLFLSQWCTAEALRRLADRSLGGQRGHVDGFRAVAGSKRSMVRAVPRGLVAHWLSGNVPMLGMLTLVQSILTKNANILKASATFQDVLPALLDGFRGLHVDRPDGKVLRGDDILSTIAVIYYAKEDRVAAEALSRAADVRLAWGGSEAIEAIMQLPRRPGTEDIVFGPKLSFMVVGRDQLGTENQVRKLARHAATDVSVFDQYACASPHVIFVESGGAAASPRDFAGVLAEEMAKAAVRIPKGPVDAATAAAITSARLRHQASGQVWCSAGTEWTVLHEGHRGSVMPEPCYSRVVTVWPVSDVMEALDYAARGIQTIGLALSGERMLRFASAAALAGVERFPEVGRMTHFDSPWDGLIVMDRLVRWVSVGGPAV